MKLGNRKFEKELIKYISLKGIDISIQLENGKIIHLNKNREFKKGYVIHKPKGIEQKIPLKQIKKAEFYVI